MQPNLSKKPDQGASGHNLAILNRLAEFRDLRDGWAGPRSVAPDHEQIDALEAITRAASDVGLVIDRVCAIADGDVLMHAFGGKPDSCGARRRRVTFGDGASVGPASWPTSTQPGSLGFGTAAPSLEDGDYVMTWFVEDGHARILVEPITIRDDGVAALVEGEP